MEHVIFQVLIVLASAYLATAAVISLVVVGKDPTQRTWVKSAGFVTTVMTLSLLWAFVAAHLALGRKEK
jgi:energy-converting hydrogenase Eha subunit A